MKAVKSVVYGSLLVSLWCRWCGVWMLSREIEPTIKEGW